jgi:hypothetical protein
MGTKPGFLDLVLYLPCRNFTGLVIEMKSGKNKLTDSQQKWVRIMMKEGKRVHACWKFEQAKATIENYMDQYFKYGAEDFRAMPIAKVSEESFK